MTLSVAALRRLASQGQDPFTLSAEQLAIETQDRFFARFLGGELRLAKPVFDSESLTLQGTLSLPAVSSSELSAVVEFARDPENDVVTGLVITVDLPQWTVAADFLHVDLSGLRLLGFTAPHLVLSLLPDKSGKTVSLAEAAVSFSRAGSSGTDQRFTALVSQREPEGDYIINGAFGEGLPLTDLAALAQTPGLPRDLTATDLALPPQVPHTAVTLTLHGLQLVYQPKTHTVTSAWVDVGIASGWPIVPGHLTLRDLHAEFHIGPPPQKSTQPGADSARRAIRTELTARLTAMGIDMAATISVPDLVLTATLGTVPDHQFLARHLSGTGLGEGLEPPDFVYARCDIRQRTYVLMCGLKADWTIVDPITLRGLILTLSGGRGQVPTAGLLGTLEIGSSQAWLDAGGNAQGWHVSGRARDISLTALDAWLRKTHGSGLPAAVRDLIVENLLLSFDTSGPRFDIGVTGSLPLSSTLQVDASMDASLTKGKAVGAALDTEVSAALSVDLPAKDAAPEQAYFLAELATGTADPHFSASWTGERGVALSEIFSPFGVMVGDLPDAHINELALRTAPGNGGRMLSLLTRTGHTRAAVAAL
ncbi:hypothetical protein [Streptomyces olivoreticuli]|uniref:hypothetical protein n=1 Tax=Streptomyces olivoreticuli TaxID=68246 RepID=UPI000E2320EC|nr:hypothetical protein [Streptomyces olivoreticuli]